MNHSLEVYSKELADKLVEDLSSREIKASVTQLDNNEGFKVEYSLAEQPVGKTADSDESDFVTKEYLYTCVQNYYSYVMEELKWQTNWHSSNVRYLEKAFYKHHEGHLPPIKGAGKMEQALEALGIGQDYEVKKAVILASVKNGEKTLLVDLKNSE